MPKCAGRAIKEFLKKNYENHLEMNNIPMLAQMTEDQLNAYDLIEGHISYEYVKRLRQFKCMTILRDPLERTISQYNHFMTMKTSVEEASILKVRNYSFRDFVTTNNPNLSLWINIYTVQLGDNGDPIFNVREYLKRAIKHLNEMAFVGIYEQMDETIKALKKKFNLTGDVEIIGKTPNEYKTKISEEDYEVAKKCLIPDYILYNMARGAFNEMGMV